MFNTFSHIPRLYKIDSSPPMNTKRNFSLCKQHFNVEDSASYMNDTDEREARIYEELSSRLFHIQEMGHQVLVIQPYIKWGANKKRNTVPDLQLAEAVTLVATLKNWKVVEKIKMSLTSFDKKFFFGTGNLKMLKEKSSKQ
ncbi:hypothetical protein L9F63_022520 [Diploptera punctata]|uniref:Uncharacterized protein n=1 Tax=Diploptera punctata TaxID=6984 RepID=A0AAD7ZMM2_DIPPU|nr:hypothetical protein L9F63_022520 [Diploptera punctata]